MTDIKQATGTTELTYKQVVEIYESCSKLAGIELPIWWTLVRNIQELQPEYDKFNKAKQSIIDKFALKDENGNVKTINTGNSVFVDFGSGENAKLAAEHNEELLKEVVKVNLKTISINKLKGLDLKPADMYFLVGTVLTGEIEE